MKIYQPLKLTFQSDHFANRIHDGRICRDRPTNRVGWVRHINDDHLEQKLRYMTYIYLSKLTSALPGTVPGCKKLNKIIRNQAKS